MIFFESLRKLAAVFAILLLIGYPILVYASTVSDTSCDVGEFGSGSNSDTECVSNQVQLDSTGMTNGSGNFTSRVIDAGGSAAWSGLSWTPNFPYFKNVPDNGATESVYANGNIDASGILVSYHMDESSWDGTADEVLDGSGDENHGVRVGNADTNASGRIDRAGSFDGGGDYVNAGTITTLGINTDKTVSLWIYINSKGSAERVFTKNKSSHALGYGIAFETNGNLVSFFNDGTEIKAGFGNFSTGVWYHLVSVYDESTPAITNYVNGSLVSVTAGAGWGFDANDALQVGGRAGASQWFDGKIDEFTIWEGSLSATDVSALYKRGALRLLYQVRSCDDDACSGESFIGPDGTGATYYSELTSPQTGFPSKTLTNLEDNQYFQYKAYFETLDDTLTPELLDLTVSYTSLVSGVPEFSDTVYLVSILFGVCYMSRALFQQHNLNTKTEA
ncbi:LamG domain-containing protein [Candidatus Nomurabacteria bacterium]|nr:LamG domain-containing protein [Candidatus Nomurabacteria bacterium]